MAKIAASADIPVADGTAAAVKSNKPEMTPIEALESKDIPAVMASPAVGGKDPKTGGLVRRASSKWYEEEEKERTVEEDLAMIEDMLKTPPEQRWVLHPLSEFMQKWDKAMVCLLLFTALMTPFEVAFLETKFGVLFVVNRFVDLGFIADIFVNFNLAYLDEEENTYVFKKNLIGKRYLKGWFAIDFISILPFDSLGLVMQDSSISDLKIFRIIRLMRLLKLMRVLKSMRIIGRLQATLGISFATFALIQLLLAVIVCMHWVACLWMLAGQVDSEGKSTLTDYDTTWVIDGGLVCPYYEVCGEEGVSDDTCGPEEDFADCTAPGERLETILTEYMGALEFSMMIMVMGYGAFEPANPFERGTSIVAMLIAGCVYAYAIGDICGVVSMRNPAAAEYQQKMDTLNLFMEEIQLPQEKRVELRLFFMSCKDMFQMRYYAEVLEDMSPKMRGLVAEHTHGEWMKSIPFFNASLSCAEHQKATAADEALRFRSLVACHLEAAAFSPMEEVYRAGDVSEYMYIIHKGVCAGNGRVLGKGKFFGEEMILEGNRRQWDMRALTFLFVYRLNRETLHEEVLEKGDFPLTKKLIRKATIKMALQNKFMEIRRMYRAQNKMAAKVGARDVKAWKKKMYHQRLQREETMNGNELTDEEKRAKRKKEWEAKQKEREEEEQQRQLAFFLGEADDDGGGDGEEVTLESLAKNVHTMQKMVEQLVLMVGKQQAAK